MFKKNLLNASRKTKRSIVILNDFLIIYISILFSMWSNLENLYSSFSLIGLPLLCIIFFKVFNVYDNVIKHINIEKVITINLLLFLSHIIFPITYNFFYEFKITIISLSLSFFMSAYLLRFSRVVAKYLLYKNKDINTMEDVIIFLGKDDNEDIISTIDENDLYNIVAIISQEKDYSGLYLKGHKVYHLSSLESIIKNKNIRKLFVHSKAYAGIKNNLYEIISKFPLRIVEIPNIEEIISGKDDLNILKKLSIEDIADRSISNKIEINSNFFKKKSILVTGGGGSIGSVLCKEILKNTPKKLIVLDNSEFALFNISRKLKKSFPKIDIQECLLDLKDSTGLRKFFELNDIDIIYHAAAYKHVHLVEKNIQSSIKNNIIGFINVLKAASENNIKNVTLVSTDKAVSPSTSMGMTKRVCEMILLNEYKKDLSRNYSAVRFGNVFNSSGSVISIFKEQIQKGEDLTLTDPDATRYFMSIKEAANLVIKSSTISKGGELFILDMGQPLKIIDVAKKMIHLSGKTIKSSNNKFGDIAINVVGLLPSEKLHEELSQSTLSRTKDDKIYLSDDLSIQLENLENLLDDLLDECNTERELLDKLKKLSSN